VKKIIIGIVSLAVVGIIASGLYLKNMVTQMDQVVMQYTNETISDLKRDLDFTPFEKDLLEITVSRMEELQNVITSESALEIQNRILKGEITNKELVLTYVKRIESHNKNLNAVIQLNPKVLAQAIALDEKYDAGEQVGSLFGMTVIIKDNIASIDMNTSAGAEVLRNVTTDRDAFLVDSLKSEDALILAKANLSEWSNFMSMPSSNGFSVLGGQTKNPYGQFDVGGSSSGSSVAVAASFSSVSIGTETAGSLIYPAGQNSVVALKPTLGTISRDLIVPISEAQDTSGVIGKTVEDVAIIFEVAVKADTNDSQSSNAIVVKNDLEVIEFDKLYLKGKRIGYFKTTSYPTDQVEKDFEQLGATLVQIQLPEVEVDMMTVLNYGIIHDVETFLSHPEVNSDIHSLNEVIDYNKLDPNNRMPFGAALLENAIAINVTEDVYEATVKSNRDASASAIDSVLKENELDAVLSFSNELSGLYAPAMYPAITVPAGYTETGEPFGITIVGTLNSDAELLKMAFAYEQGSLLRKNPELTRDK